MVCPHLLRRPFRHRAQLAAPRQLPVHPGQVGHPHGPVPLVHDLKVEGDETYMTVAALLHNGGKRTEKPTRTPSQASDGSAGSGGDSGSPSDPPSDGKLPAVEAREARDGRPSDAQTDAQAKADPPLERKGMYTTVLRFEGEHSICLYFTGRRHAGENLDDLLAHRDPRLPPIQWMSDGLAANTPKEHKDQAVDLSCLVHGRRQVVDIEAFFPSECARVIDAIATVYKHEAHCKDHPLTAAQRLAYHQEHSREVMDELKTWMEQQLQERLVEPNSRLGGAFAYLLKRWKALTRFLHIPGAPLDNNTAERALKIILRYRKNSLWFWTWEAVLFVPPTRLLRPP